MYRTPSPRSQARYAFGPSRSYSTSFCGKSSCRYQPRASGMPASARYTAAECVAVSIASTRYDGARFAFRYEIADDHVLARVVASPPFLKRLHASGDTFHANASARMLMQIQRGCQRRSDQTSTISGTEAYRSRAMFSPIAVGTRYMVTIAKR